MKNASITITFLLISFLSGCLKSEAESMEADILEILLPDSILIAPAIISNSFINAFVNYDKINIKSFSPGYVLTPGATSPKDPYLSETNILTYPSLVAVASVSDRSSTTGSGFKIFDIPFRYRKDYNPADLAAYGYKLTVVFSSSKNGAIFEGAVGSMLPIDNIKVLTE